MILGLIINNINFSKGAYKYSAERFWTKSDGGTKLNNTSSDTITIKFTMSIPNHINDKEMIKDSSMSIKYSKNIKKNRRTFTVTLENVDKPYPAVGNNKYLIIRRQYNIIDWIKNGVNFHAFLSAERELIFREIRSNIVLNEIHELSKKWSDINDGIYNNGFQPVYALSKFDENYDFGYNISFEQLIEEEQVSVN